jgi:hypothetical protein
MPSFPKCIIGRIASLGLQGLENNTDRPKERMKVLSQHRILRWKSTAMFALFRQKSLVNSENHADNEH